MLSLQLLTLSVSPSPSVSPSLQGVRTLVANSLSLSPFFDVCLFCVISVCVGTDFVDFREFVV